MRHIVSNEVRDFRAPLLRPARLRARVAADSEQQQSQCEKLEWQISRSNHRSASDQARADAGEVKRSQSGVSILHRSLFQ